MSKIDNFADYAQQDELYAIRVLFFRKTTVELTALATAKKIGIGTLYYDITLGVFKLGVDSATTLTLQGNAVAGAFTTLSASSTVSGAGFTTFMAAPPAIGTTTPGIVKTSNLQATYTDSSATPGNVTNNSPRGTIALAAASQTITVTNSLVTAASMIITSVRSTDGLATIVVTALPAAGSFTLTMNGITTGTNCKVDFMVVN